MKLRQLLYTALIIITASLTACTDSYSVSGTTSVTRFEGATLVLSVYDGATLLDIDSCRVRDGKFTFSGKRDSVEMAMIFYSGSSLMPVLLEATGIDVQISDTAFRAGGSVMNDSLYKFIGRKAQLDKALEDIPSRLSQLIMDGADIDEVQPALALEAARIKEMADRTVIDFVKQNINNPLGPGVFMLVTRDNTYPILSPAIEEILTCAGTTFLSDSYVSKYIETAEENALLRREGKPLIQM